MTAKEAIKQLCSLREDRKSFFDKNNFDDEIYRLDAEACTMGIDALEKQIKMKPSEIKLHDEMPSIPTVKCPICHEFVVYNSKYCHHCGQALDWS